MGILENLAGYISLTDEMSDLMKNEWFHDITTVILVSNSWVCDNNNNNNNKMMMMKREKIITRMIVKH